MSETFYVVPEAQHNALVEAAYRHRGFTQDEAEAAARFATYATTHGIRTHNALKALHLDHIFGSHASGCMPGATIEKKSSRFAACAVWNANRKLGQAVAYEAIDEAIRLADVYGVGTVSVDDAFHYLWGGGYVMEAAKRGYIAYTNCTAAQTEVVPYQGVFPTLGTNPHSWGFPTQEAVGFPIIVDWATSVVSMGRVQQLAREGFPLPPDSALDRFGQSTTDPQEAVYLLPFGRHKGYGLSLINELVAGLIGGSTPTIRGRWPAHPEATHEKYTATFFFQVIHPEAMSGSAFAAGRSQAENVKAVLDDILGHGNENCLWPGQVEAEAAQKTAAAGGLLFSAAELGAFDQVADECGQARWDRKSFPIFED